MRLDFTVLWFENQFEQVGQAIQALRLHLEEAGLNLVLLEASDHLSIDRFAREQERFNEIDLIVVDLDLGYASEGGDAVAERIRARFSFTDIVFYSGVAPSELRSRIRERDVDGVYCMDRRDLRNNLVELVDNMVRRMSRLEGMRGLAVSAASHADRLMRDILLLIHRAGDDAKKAEVVAFLDREVSETDDRLARKYAAAEGMEAKVSSHACTSMVLLKTVKHFVKPRGDLEQGRIVLKRYQVEVLNIRNSLGHAVETKGEDGWSIACGDGSAITASEFATYRSNFSRHLANLEGIKALLDGAPASSDRQA